MSINLALLFAAVAVVAVLYRAVARWDRRHGL